MTVACSFLKAGQSCPVGELDMAAFLQVALLHRGDARLHARLLMQPAMSFGRLSQCCSAQRTGTALLRGKLSFCRLATMLA